MQNIIENNKIIAEFLGYINTTPSDKVFSIYENNANPFLGKTLLEPMSMKFNSDWNWLMKVVEKILNVSLELDSMEMYYNITDSIPHITKTYEKCIEFIKWYNENK